MNQKQHTAHQVVFVLSSLTDAHQRIRIDLLQAEGVDVKVLAFQRDYYPGKPHTVETVKLGRVVHGKYRLRLSKMFKALPTIREHIGGAVSVYVWGLDLLFLTVLARTGLEKKPTIVYEIADVREALVSNSVFGSGLRRVEKWLMHQVDLLVVTSEAFVERYLLAYRRIVPSAYIVLENKVRPNLPSRHHGSRFNRGDPPRYRIGFFGTIRCPRSLEILLSVAEKSGGRVSVYMRGILIDLDGRENEFTERLAAAEHVDFAGPYVNPDDLPDLYSKIDLAWASYPYSRVRRGNWQWARTNRFYEACYYRRPVIASAGTRDGRRVESLGVGICLPLGDFDRSVELLLGLSTEDIVRWTHNLERLDPTEHTYTSEHGELAAWMQRNSLA